MNKREDIEHAARRHLLIAAVITSIMACVGCGGIVDPSPKESPLQDPGSPLGCEAIKQAVQAELQSVAKCSSDLQCKWAFIGTGCTGALPLCGFPHANGVSLSSLESLDQQYRDSDCGEGEMACAGCATSAGELPAMSCVSGVCALQFGD